MTVKGNCNIKSVTGNTGEYILPLDSSNLKSLTRANQPAGD
jgi:hypothetical protein